MAGNGAGVRAQGIVYFLALMIVFATFINLYKPPKVVVGNIVSRHVPNDIQMRISSSLNFAPTLGLTSVFKCIHAQLWGREHGGGWNICSDPHVFTGKDPLAIVPEDKCVVYSFGLGADWSFDNAAESRGCEVLKSKLCNKLSQHTKAM